MEGFGFKALAPIDQWTSSLPALTKFTPGHDHRILDNLTTRNVAVDISLEFDTEMDCASVTRSISLNLSSSGKGGTPTMDNVTCGAIANPDPARLPGSSTSVWSWSATLRDFADGVLGITVINPMAAVGNISTEMRLLSSSFC